MTLLLRTLLVATAAAAIGLTHRILTAPIAILPASAPPPRHLERAVGPSPRDTAANAASRFVFRARRQGTHVAYDPAKLASAAMPPAAPKPGLTVSGIIWSASPAAVLSGIPGLDGSRVVIPGDSIAGLRVKRISAGEVVIAGLDTVWNLHVKEVWR
jgi:hypothetical protein